MFHLVKSLTPFQYLSTRLIQGKNTCRCPEEEEQSSVSQEHSSSRLQSTSLLPSTCLGGGTGRYTRCLLCVHLVAIHSPSLWLPCSEARGKVFLMRFKPRFMFFCTYYFSEATSSGPNQKQVSSLDQKVKLPAYCLTLVVNFYGADTITQKWF